MKYINGKRDITLILSINDSRVLNWWIDASYAVYPNIRGHTGGGISMGRGFTIFTLTNNNINTRSSTELDIDGVQDCMLTVCWTRYFTEAQGYLVTETFFTKKKGSPFFWRVMGIHQVSILPSTSKYVSF